MISPAQIQCHKPSYTTPAITAEAATNRCRVVVSYPGVGSVTSRDAGVIIACALGAPAYSNRPLYAGWPIAWLVAGNLAQVFHGEVDIAPGFAYEVNLRPPLKIQAIWLLTPELS